MTTVLALLFGLVLTLCIYMLPALISHAKGSSVRREMFWLNLCLGWTGILWLVFLLVALILDN